MPGGLPSVDRRATLALAVVEAVAILLLIFGDRVPTGVLQGGAAVVLAPANALLRWAGDVAAARSELTRLRTELAATRIERDRLVDAGIENRRLRALLGFSARAGNALKPFQVVGVAGEPWPVVYHLGGGTRAGLRPGLAVLSAEGLVGRITRVDAATASVALVTDPNAPVACEVVGTGVRGVLKFRFGSDSGLYLTAVPLTDTVRVGERIATSAISLLYPPGIPVGRVVRVGRDPSGLLSEILVVPFAPLSRLREVLVAMAPVDQTWWRQEAPPPAPADTARGVR